MLQRMTDILAHRGPDDEGHYLNGSIGLGHRRLAIIDLTPAGRQPMANEDETVWITYNGECYNYRDFYPLLRSKGHRFRSTTDTEVLLHLYEEYGMDFLEKIDGMFAFAIWDEKKRRLVLARDRIGIKPLFYYLDANHLIFASELKALLVDPGLPTELDYTALSYYFRLKSIPDPHSILRGVKKLLPGHYLCIENGKTRLHRYWDVSSFTADGAADLKSASQGFHDRFQQAVTSHLVADVPVGAFLSGGVDSSSVVSVASRQVNEPLQTLSVTFQGLSDFDESAYAREVASHCHTEHHELNLTPSLVDVLPTIVWHSDEPFAISSAFALYFLSEMARDHVKVVLTGDGADEVFAGYPYRHGQATGIVNSLPLAMRRLLKPIVSLLDPLNTTRSTDGSLHRRATNLLRQATSLPSESYIQSFSCYGDAELSELLAPERWRVMEETWSSNLLERYYNSLGNTDELTRKLYTDIKSTLVSEMLTKVDRMTMAFGVEARVPFLDHHLVEWAFRVPSEYKFHGSDGKYLVKKAMERHLPNHILYRPKHGFNVPMAGWMQNELRQFVLDTLSEATLKSRGLFRADAVNRLLNRNFDTPDKISNQVIVLLMLELWFQQFVDNRHLLSARPR